MPLPRYGTFYGRAGEEEEELEPMLISYPPPEGQAYPVPKGAAKRLTFRGVVARLAVVMFAVMMFHLHASGHGFAWRKLSNIAASLQQRKPPNFLIIVVDDQGMGDIGYLNSHVRTPVIDSLAGDGITLDQFYTQPLCTPARGALLTGKYPITTGTQFETVPTTGTWGLALNSSLLPQYLLEAGYSTHIIGKWHLGHAQKEYLPIKRGFQTFYGYLGAEIYHDTHLTTTVCHCDGPFTDLISMNGDEITFVMDNTTLTTDLFTDEALRLMNEVPSHQPLFLEVAYQNIHKPLPEVSWERLSEEESAFVESYDIGLRQRFVANTIMLDRAVERLIGGLKESGRYDNTYIIYLSDNGACYEAGGLNLPYRGVKHGLFEGALRVPSFLTGALVPNKVRGTNYNGYFHVSDWAPTILSLAHVSVPEGLDGTSHAKALLTGGSSERMQILLNFNNVTGTPSGGFISGKWKFLLNQLNQTYYTEDDMEGLDVEGSNACDYVTTNDYKGDWLFDLEADPYETTNLVDDYPEIADELYEMMLDFYSRRGMESYWGGTDETLATEMFTETGYVCPFEDEDSSYFLPPIYTTFTPLGDAADSDSSTGTTGDDDDDDDDDTDDADADDDADDDEDEVVDDDDDDVVVVAEAEEEVVGDEDDVEEESRK